jgi:predicted DNA-binding ribbon-helix-helix protein
MELSTTLLRLFWTVVEEMSRSDRLHLNDSALVTTLVNRISARVLLTGEEASVLYHYIGSRIALIRDTAAFSPNSN